MIKTGAARSFVAVIECSINRKGAIRSSVDMITLGSRKLRQPSSPDHSASGGYSTACGKRKHLVQLMAYAGRFGVQRFGGTSKVKENCTGKVPL